MPEPVDPTTGAWVRCATLRDRRADVVLAGLLLVGTAVTVPLWDPSPWPSPRLRFDVAWAVLITVPLAWRRRWPSAVAVIVATAYLVGQFTGEPEPLVSQITPFVALYSVGAWSPDRRRSHVVRTGIVAVFVACLVVLVTTAPGRLPQQIGNLSASSALALAALSTAVYLAAAVAFGETAWRSARRLAALEYRTAELQAERERTAAQAVALERVRIARELHDVVAHHISVIGVQAGAARRVLATAPDRAADALIAIEDNARQAVGELHHTLVALRTSEPSPGPTRAASTLGVEQLTELVAESERSGTPTTLIVDGEARRLPPTVALTLYRVTQEALTNVRKHAGPGARAAVRLRYAASAVELEVADTGGRIPEPAVAVVPVEPSSGMGQLGMRERVAAAGGALRTNPAGDGYVVSATLPTEP